jgi:hypothetical protein
VQPVAGADVAAGATDPAGAEPAGAEPTGAAEATGAEDPTAAAVDCWTGGLKTAPPPDWAGEEKTGA